MSDIIQLLPDSVANQIAAGEVIQRPASVIKELVENAIDAGATHVDVVVVDAGRTLIQVIDDGTGMSETDARLAFERHATSKIRKADDLFTLQTMGFRGEALPSIAAVAQVELTTRRAEDEVGVCLQIAASKVVRQEPVACPVGSNFKVENLFYNVPARRKFLKSNATELQNIVQAFERIVLVYPKVNFTLQSNNLELLNLKTASLRQRIDDVFGRKGTQDLLPVNVETTVCTIEGYVGRPETARKKGIQQFFFVNGRYMRHPYFHKAVMNAYERLVPQGLVTPYYIYIKVDPADIDVNIHPTKTEIKFENEQTIFQMLQVAVKDAIGRFIEVPLIDFDSEGQPDLPLFGSQNSGGPQMPTVSVDPDYNPFRSGTTPRTPTYLPQYDIPQTPRRKTVDNSWQQLYDQAVHRAQPAPAPTLFPDDDAEETQSIDAERSPQHYQYKGCYIMTAVKSGLMIINQHRADLRIRYDRIIRQLQAGSIPTQRLLFTDIVQFAPSDITQIETFLPELQAMGFEMTPLGGGSYAVSGVPAGIDGVDISRLITTIVSDAIDQGHTTPQQLHETVALSLARHSAIADGQVLTNEEMEQVVNSLFLSSNVKYTPDGLPILTILPHSDIEKLF